MINEERVKQLYKVALCEQGEEEQYKHTGKYYKSDYIGKEILKSIFTGTIAYLLVLVFALIDKWEELLTGINQLEVEKTLIPAVVVYIGYMSVYLAGTYMIYKARYQESQKHLEEYEKELLVLENMYDREEKIK